MELTRGLRVLSFTMLALLLTACASKPAPSTKRAATRDFSAQKWLEARWIMEVLTSAEAGSRRLHVARWTKPVVVVANNGNETQLAALQQVIGQINAALDGAHPLTLAARGTDLGRSANVRVQFAPQKDWPALGKKWGMPVPLPDGGLDGLQFVSWNEKIEIEAGVVVIGDGLKGDLLQHTLLEELYQTMGIRNDSGFFPDSIVYESDGDTGGRTLLSERDKKLIRFLYQHVPPGTRPDGLAKIIDEHWVYGVK